MLKKLCYCYFSGLKPVSGKRLRPKIFYVQLPLDLAIWFVIESTDR